MRPPPNSSKLGSDGRRRGYTPGAMAPKPPDPRHDLGREGERIAERFLRRRGLKTVVRRYNTPVGELDLVMREADTVVFVEVKARQDRDAADPQETVPPRKQHRLTRAARWFLHAQRWEERPCRFDVVSVVWGAGRDPQIEYVADAFLPK